MNPEEIYGWLSILPPLVAIGLAIATRQVVLSLLAGVWIGCVIAAQWNPFTGTAGAITLLINVFGEAWQTRVILFTLLMGSLLILMQRSGGIAGFINWVSRWKWSQTRRGAMMMACLTGLGVFIESTITCLVVGTVSRPLFDRLKISREKLAYICDSTSAPVCILLPINGWGATVLGLLGAQAAAGNLGDSGALSVFLLAVPLNFYAILAVTLVFIVCLTGWDFGPMKKAEHRARTEGKLLRDGAMPVVDTEVIAIEPKEGIPPRLRNMMLPLGAMLFMVPAGIVITGINGVRDAEIASPGLMDYLNQASGSLAVLWGVLFGVAVACVILMLQRAFPVKELVDLSFKGAGGMMPLATIMMLAFAIGMTCNMLGTGVWVAKVTEPYLSASLIAPVVFIVSGFIAFATGTSWGTFSIMMPLAVPLAASFNGQDPGAVSIPLVVSAVLGGGVFGDHCSPISDTTVVSSMAACSDHVDHVRTQMPYALLVAAVTVVLYLGAGLVL
jgi:Na+/H+ antiporter NhaC